MPESSTAISAATIEPCPPRSAYNPERSVSTPILAVLSWAIAPPLAANSSEAPSTSAEILFLISFSSCDFFSLFSDAEIGVKLVHVGLQFGVGETVDDLAVLDDVEAIRDRGCKAEIL